MKIQHLIFCDAGCFEAGNELNEDRRLMIFGNEAEAKVAFVEACTSCETHVDKQINLIESTHGMESTSDYYWTVIWISLPESIEAGIDTILDQIPGSLGKDDSMESLVKKVEGRGKDLGDAIKELGEWLQIE